MAGDTMRSIGSSIKSSMGAGIGRQIKEGVTRGAKEFASSGGGKELVRQTAGRALAGGAVGAGVNAVRGEDVWQGAATGAVIGGGYSAARNTMDMSGVSASDVGRGIKGIRQEGKGAIQKARMPMSSSNLPHSIRRGISTGPSVAKDVSVLQNLGKHMQKSQNVVNRGS